MPVDNNGHQRIDDVGLSTTRRAYILRYTVSRDNGFRIVTHELIDCCVQSSQLPSLSVMTCRCEKHGLAMF